MLKAVWLEGISERNFVVVMGVLVLYGEMSKSRIRHQYRERNLKMWSWKTAYVSQWKRVQPQMRKCEAQVRNIETNWYNQETARLLYPTHEHITIKPAPTTPSSHHTPRPEVRVRIGLFATRLPPESCRILSILSTVRILSCYLLQKALFRGLLGLLSRSTLVSANSGKWYEKTLVSGIAGLDCWCGLCEFVRCLLTWYRVKVETID
ncbi:hypothetical protein K402DRAFT_7180 [Aulographum hederae CBS 113979]|uniref:Uncharacterized protein n=1 Tax=Aulographum hederae CBS 113979 TaxID=1176131 RepID=A0A6G1HHR1_9PEZI|nr:hypothetical protein K402DRAFT_7180 [Aulographum hederae CBS 113979]